MSEPGPSIRNISDTARWVAAYRADETERADAVFKDPFARRLAGDRGRRIVDGLPGAARHSWAMVARTIDLDRYVLAEVARGADLVLNLAAGLDTRPYRLDLPASLRWVEVDLPELFDFKEGVLAGETPKCKLERVRLDLADGDARRALFARLGRESKRALVITEGLVIYLAREEVAALARDLAAVPAFKSWALDMVSPGLMKMMLKEMAPQLEAAKAPFQFAPEEGPAFFEQYGWTPAVIRSNLKTGAEIGRLPFFLRLIALLPDPGGRQGSRPWGGNCLFARSVAA
jgi:methyltransferase (TIGR00027 family)